MPHLIRLACGAGLLASAFSICAANHPSTTSEHWGVGIQAAVTKSTANSENQFRAVGSADDVSDYRHNGSATTSLFGISAGRYWTHGKSTWGLELEANQGSGDIFIMHHLAEGHGLNENPTQINTNIKPKQQYNLMLLWKHKISSDFSFLAGFGVSALNTETHLAFIDNEDYNFISEYNRTTISESRYTFGPAFTFGFEHMLSKHAAIDFTLSYTAYGSMRLSDFNDFSFDDPDLNTEHELTHRKTTLDQLALGASYHYYF